MSARVALALIFIQASLFQGSSVFVNRIRTAAVVHALFVVVDAIEADDVVTIVRDGVAGPSPALAHGEQSSMDCVSWLHNHRRSKCLVLEHVP